MTQAATDLRPADRLTNLVTMAMAALQRLEDAERHVETCKAHRDQLLREAIPDVLGEMGLAKVVLANGLEVSLKNVVNASLVDEGAVAWLDAHGYGGIVRTEIKLGFAGDSRSRAIEVAEKISAATGESVEMKTSVHPSTLKSFAAERMAAGEALPVEHFNTHTFVEAKIVRKAK